MKKFTAPFMAITFAIMAFTACKSTTPLKDSLYSELSKQDLQLYAETMGEIGYYLCAYYANDPKHADKVERLQTIFAAIEKAKNDGNKENVDLAALNDATADIIALLATSELGPVYGQLAGKAAKALIATGYHYYKSNVEEDNLEIVLTSICNGVMKARANGADILAKPTSIDELIAMEPSEECGLQCLTDKIRSAIDAGGLTNYDKKRLEKRLKELDDMKKEIEKEVEAERLKEKK